MCNAMFTMKSVAMSTVDPIVYTLVHKVSPSTNIDET